MHPSVRKSAPLHLLWDGDEESLLNEMALAAREAFP